MPTCSAGPEASINPAAVPLGARIISSRGSAPPTLKVHVPTDRPPTRARLGYVDDEIVAAT